MNEHERKKNQNIVLTTKMTKQLPIMANMSDWYSFNQFQLWSHSNLPSFYMRFINITNQRINCASLNTTQIHQHKPKVYNKILSKPILRSHPMAPHGIQSQAINPTCSILGVLLLVF